MDTIVNTATSPFIGEIGRVLINLYSMLKGWI